MSKEQLEEVGELAISHIILGIITILLGIVN